MERAPRDRCTVAARDRRAVKLVVNADDLGYTPGVTRGIVRAHREGIVTAATLMVNAPDTAGAARAARETPSLDVGVHLVFTYGHPLTDPARIPSLVNADGRFPRMTDVASERRAARDDVLVEARAQYERAREILGREPTHIDTHHWIHDVPAIEDGVAALATETGAALRSHDPAQRDRFRARGIRTTDRFVREFQHAGSIDVPALVSLLERIAAEGGVVELMTHPGDPDAALLGGSAYAEQRGVELATLTDARVGAAVARLDIELVDYRAV